MDYGWPGNVRELKNCVEGMVVMSAPDRELAISDVPAHIRNAPAGTDEADLRPGMTMKQIERLAIEQTLKAVDYDRRKAAKMLEIGLSTLYRKEKEYGLRR